MVIINYLTYVGRNNNIGSKGATHIGNSLAGMNSLKTLELNLWYYSETYLLRGLIISAK